MYRLRKIFHRRKSLASFIRCKFSTSHLHNVKIDKILIANRGEIACRIIKTAKRMGVKTVAIYSDSDRNSMQTELADEAFYIGPSPSTQSYLRQDKIILLSKKYKCQAIHPGYGFLSENMEFADLCQKENIIFIGPPASAIRDMGIKSTSKTIMNQAKVPIIQGYHSHHQDDKTLLEQARNIGFPVMIKAVRGGGGKGMRIAEEEMNFLEALQSARTESQKAFGNSDVLLEKYVINPRHIEVQIFADKHNNAVYLYERDCSVQRRHQKIIEEAPAPHLSDKLRAQLGQTAVRAAKAVGYVGAGTVEFIMDSTDQSFYFMEMNTRLQVEHPITEAITGLDLVEWQLRIASGEKIPFKQEEIHIKGHAFESRIYAEDPRRGFLPGAGPLLHLTPPKLTQNVRVDTGVRQGDEVSVHYDPMIAKLIVWGNDRHEALNHMITKLSEYNIVGVETNIEFLKDLCCHPKFQAGKVHTGFINDCMDSLFPRLQAPHDILCQAVLGLIFLEDMKTLKAALQTQNIFNPFHTEIGFRLNHILTKRFELFFNNDKHVIDVKFIEPEVYLMQVNEIGPWQRIIGTLTQKENILQLRSEIGDIKKQCRIVKINNELHIFTNDRAWKLVIPKPNFLSKLEDKIKSDEATLSPMPGIVDKILVSLHDSVKKGDPLLVVVAMKMEHVIRASLDGTIEEILCAVGDTVTKDYSLMKITGKVKK